MAWCDFCRSDVNADPGMYCPACGYQIGPSTESGRHATALAQLTAPVEEEPEVTYPTYSVPSHPMPPPPQQQQPTVIVYQQIVHQASRRTGSNRPHVQTIERTGKFWKGQMVLSALMCIAGTVLASLDLQAGHPDGLFAIGALTVLVGLGWFVFARLGAWWNHG